MTYPNAVFAENPQQAGQSILSLPAIAIGESAGSLSFSHYYDTEATWDGGVLEIKIGTGDWVDILTSGATFLSGGYNLAIAGINNPLAGRSGWSGDSGGFITTTVALPSSATDSTVQFRFILGHDQRVSANGWFIDDVVWRAFSCDTSGFALALTSSDASVSEYFSATDVADISVFAALPVPTDTTVSLSATGTADPSLDVIGFGDLVITTGMAGVTATIVAVSDGIVEGEESMTVSSPEASGTVQVTVEDTPYGQWAASQLSTSGAVNPLDDFDSDGSVNVEELVFLTDGVSSNSFPVIRLVSHGQDVKLVVPLGSLPEGVLVDAQVSGDLITWSSTGISTLPDGFLIPGAEIARYLRLVYRTREYAP